MVGLCRSHDDEPEGLDCDLQGVYSNFFDVGYNAYEFLIDFGQFYPGGRKHWHTRIVTTPEYARNLLEVLRESIERFEQAFPAGRKWENE